MGDVGPGVETLASRSLIWQRDKVVVGVIGGSDLIMREIDILYEE